MDQQARARGFVAIACAVLCLQGCSSSNGGGVPPTSTALPSTATATASRTATVTPPPTATATATPPLDVLLFRVSGHLLGSGRDYEVTLQPSGRTTASVDAYFEFDDVAPGEYVLHVDDGCGVVPCFDDTPISVVDGDVTVDLVNQLCPTPAVSPGSGPAGTAVGFGGRCYYLHSGASGYVYFDNVRAGDTTDGDTLGNYGGRFVVPLDTTPGTHTVTVSSSPIGPTPRLFSFPFVVTSE